jgi:hypothetical protein
LATSGAAEADPFPANNTANAQFTVTNPVATTGVTVTVTAAGGAAVPAGQNVRVFTVDTNGITTTATTISDTTNVSGTVTFNLPDGNYVFIADEINTGARYSSTTCTVPGCTSTDLFMFTTINVTVTSAAANVAGQVVYVYDDSIPAQYQGISDTTNISGTVSFDLNTGNYMFYAYDVNGGGYGSVPVPCAAPTCNAASITMPVFGSVDVTVTDGVNTVPNQLVDVYTFDVTNNTTATTTIAGFTNASGVVSFTLAAGDYKFAATDTFSNTFLSSACTVPTCTASSLLMGALNAVTVTVQDSAGNLLDGRSVQVYTVDANGIITPTVISAATISGTVNFDLPSGVYKFGASNGDSPFYSTECTVPGCTDALITLPVAVTLPAATCSESGGVRTCDLYATPVR